MSRFRGPDWALLLTLAPLWAICFGLHVNSVITNGLGMPAMYVHPETPGDHPTVEGFWAEFRGRTDLEIGDRVLRLGDLDLRGVAAYQFVGIAIEQAGPSREVPIEFERGGERRRGVLRIGAAALPWSRTPLVTGLALLAIVVLLRAPGSNDSRLAYAAFISFSIFQCIFRGGPKEITYLGYIVFHVMGPVAILLLCGWAIRFPPDVESRRRAPWILAVAPAVVWLAARLSLPLGGPLPVRNVVIYYYATDAIVGLVLVGVLSWNYWSAAPVGRRRIKWVLLGAYVAALPIVLVSLLSALAPGFPWFGELHTASIVAAPAAPLGILLAIALYNLYDIDRLISGTASYSILIVALALAGELLFEPLAGATAMRLGIAPDTGQILFVGALTGLLIPAQRVWRPYVDRIFFSGGVSLEDQVEALLEDLSRLTLASPQALVERFGGGVDRIFEPTFCVVYRLVGDEFTPAFAAGSVLPDRLDADERTRIVRALRTRVAPLRLGLTGRQRESPELVGAVREALPHSETSVVVPLRPGGPLGGFLCLGPKASRDVYTSTDVSLLSTLAHHVSEEIAGEQSER